jgi:hypothetical protein
MHDYFFSGDQYIRMTRVDTGPGTVDPGYPAPISNWGWGEFGRDGIDAALYSGSKCYFFAGAEYIRVTRGETGPGAVDPGYPAPISNWGWGQFGRDGIDAALWSGSKCYFFAGREYIRVTRGETGPGTVDPGYPAPISNWNWGHFGDKGIDAALYSGSVCYFFDGGNYVRVHRGGTGAGLLDRGYPAPISNWGWGEFGKGGIDTALYSGGPLVAPPPATGLVSNHNYFLERGGQPLIEASVTIDFDADFTSEANGFSIQLNGYSAVGDLDAAQQILVFATPGSSEVVARIENWINTSTELINIEQNLAQLPSSTVPAGYSVKIQVTNDATGNVTGATFTMADELGAEIGSTTISILGHPLSTTNQPATTADLAPMTAFQLNIGGDFGGSRADLTSAIGTVTYEASTPMSAVNAPPLSFIDLSYSTVESANLTFGPLPESANAEVSHYFAMTTDGSGQVTAEELAHGHRLRPPTSVPAMPTATA